ncbi:MAG: hypothetical protein PVI06_11305 [Desulfobacterales bacterium]
MQKFKMKSAIFLGVLACVLLMTSTALTAERVYTGQGEIAAINLKDDVVVVEIPVPHDSMTVGGPLAPHAKVTQGNQPASLADFEVGETVTVRWRVTERGHIIERLSG